MVTFPLDVRSPNQPLRILIVEDDRLTARLVQSHLQKGFPEGFALDHVLNLVEGLGLMEAKTYDVLLLDLNLPDSEGLDTIQRVKVAQKNLPIVILTANDCDEASVNAIRLGAQDYLIKGSFNHRLLCRTIMHAIERHRLLRIIQRLAVLDELTGVYNRRGFNDLSANLLRHEINEDHFLTLILFDLDNFKILNDRYGHAVGDRALEFFADCLKKVFQEEEIVGRLGGDEFAVLFQSAGLEEPQQKLHYLKAWLQEAETLGDLPCPLQYSAGVVTKRCEEVKDVTSLIALADEELYNMKRARKQDVSPASSV